MDLVPSMATPTKSFPGGQGAAALRPRKRPCVRPAVSRTPSLCKSQGSSQKNRPHGTGFPFLPRGRRPVPEACV